VERGANENLNGLIGNIYQIDLFEEITIERIEIQEKLNNRPREKDLILKHQIICLIAFVT
jgi:IS30 family transposase